MSKTNYGNIKNKVAIQGMYRNQRLSCRDSKEVVDGR